MSDVKPAEVPWLSWAKKAAIAAFAGATGVLGVLVIAVTAGSDGGTSITTPEWLQAATVALTAIGGSLGVYVARNQVDPSVAARRDTGWKHDDGYVAPPLLTIIVVAVLVFFAIFGILYFANR